MNKLFILVIIFFLINNNLTAKENIMILKLKDGDVEIELFSDKAPKHVERIKKLANEVSYDNVIFNRKDQTAESYENSIFRSNNTKISSEGFNIYDNGNKIKFHGNSIIILK